MTDVKNKWTLITGSSRGLGRLAALEMARQGANLILHARTISHTDSLKAEAEALGAKVYQVECELDKADSVEKMLKAIDDLGVDVDIILNNAGLQVTYQTNYYVTPFEDYELSFRVNTIAPMMIVYHFLPKMIERGFGRIVNTTSGIALEPEQGPYSAAKAGLDKVTIDIGSRLEGTDVMINLTDPGWCRTDLGGPQAPNAPETAIPGIILGAFLDDKKSGRLIPAQDFTGLSVEEAVAKFQ